MKEGANKMAGPPSLVSLKLFLFFFFAGVGALVPFLPLHMRAAGLTAREARIVSAAAPLAGLVGPLVAALLLRRSKKGDKKRAAADDEEVVDQEAEDRAAAEEGKKLRFLLAFTVLGAAVCYSALLLLPSVTWYPARRPSVSFSCNASGAAVLQERCMEPACYRWPEQEVGPLFLTNCEYECPEAGTLLAGRLRTRGRGRTTASVAALEDSAPTQPQRAAMPAEPPHICVPDGAAGEAQGARGGRMCHVFTGSGSGITVNASLQQATNPEADRSQWCNYPVAESFSCALPSPLGVGCRVLCDIEHPYTAEGSVLAQSQCQVLVGDPALTFWSYLAVRCTADAFPTAALVMVDTALVVATRGQQASKPDLGRQVAVGLLGAAIAAPLAGHLSPFPSADPSTTGWPGWPPYGAPILAFTACMIVAAGILMCSRMPVGAGEGWWQQGSREGGRSAPSSASSACRSGSEAAALFLVLALLGAFCSAIDSYLPWHVSGLQLGAGGDWGTAAWGATPELLLGLNVLVGVLPAVPLLWRAESLVRYCGFSNLLITAFTFYIIRYAGLSLMWSPWCILALEATEVFTLSIMWVCAVLYFTQLVPRGALAAGQALCVAAHFGVGRSLGALLGGLLARDALPPDDEQDEAPPDDPQLQQLRPLYAAGAGAAALVAVLYFVAYHCCLRPQHAAPRRASAANRKRTLLADRSVLAGQNVNGSYTPLRVYHNGRGAAASSDGAL